MAITRLWQAGAEVDTTNSHNLEFDSVTMAFAASNTWAKSGSYSYRFSAAAEYGLVVIPATRQIRTGLNWYLGNPSAGDRYLIDLRTVGAAQLAWLVSTSTRDLELWVNGAQRDVLLAAYLSATEYAVGMDVKIDNAAGWAKVYLDGVEILSYTGNTGNADIERVQLGTQGGNWSTFCYMDDLYIDDTTGEAAAPVPDLRFEFISPNGVGNYSVWDPSPGGGEANWQDVDERPNDGDTTHVEAQVLNERDSYAMTTYTMAAGWAIEAVIPTTIAKKTDGGTDTKVNLMLRQGGVDDDGSDQDLPTDYGLLWDRFTLDPGGGSWSQADLDSVECGYRGRGTF